MTKLEFTKKVLEMKHPILEEGTYYEGDLLSCYLLIHDADNWKNKFETETVRLSGREYRQGKLDAYYKREKQLKTKYERWLHDVCGDYCTSKLKTA